MAGFEVGERVRVLPGARSALDEVDDSYYLKVAGDKTGLVAGGPDYDGDYDVEDDDGNYWSFAPEFLEAIEETSTPEVKVGDKVRVTIVREGIVSSKTYHEQVSPGLRLEFQMVVRTEVEILERAAVAPEVGDFVDPEGKYDTGTVAVLDNNPQSIIVRHAGAWTGNVIGDNSSDYIAPDRWKIIYIPEEAK